MTVHPVGTHLADLSVTRDVSGILNTPVYATLLSQLFDFVLSHVVKPTLTEDKLVQFMKALSKAPFAVHAGTPSRCASLRLLQFYAINRKL